MRRIKWGVLGTAYIFERDTAEGMKQAENCGLYAIAGRSMEKAQAFKEKYGFQKAYGSYEELLSDPEVEAVYIPLPNTLHYEWTLKALKAKKHVLCEKPLAPTAEEAEKMFKTAREEQGGSLYGGRSDYLRLCRGEYPHAPGNTGGKHLRSGSLLQQPDSPHDRKRAGDDQGRQHIFQGRRRHVHNRPYGI